MVFLLACHLEAVERYHDIRATPSCMMNQPTFLVFSDSGVEPSNAGGLVRVTLTHTQEKSRNGCSRCDDGSETGEVRRAVALL